MGVLTVVPPVGPVGIEVDPVGDAWGQVRQ